MADRRRIARTTACEATRSTARAFREADRHLPCGLRVREKCTPLSAAWPSESGNPIRVITIHWFTAYADEIANGGALVAALAQCGSAVTVGTPDFQNSTTSVSSVSNQRWQARRIKRAWHAVVVSLGSSFVPSRPLRTAQGLLCLVFRACSMRTQRWSKIPLSVMVAASFQAEAVVSSRRS